VITLDQALSKVGDEIDRIEQQAMFAAVLAMISHGRSEADVLAVLDTRREIYPAMRAEALRDVRKQLIAFLAES
jgi:hypothetical protein